MANSIFTRGESQTFGEHLPMTRPLKEALTFRDVVVVIRAVEIEGEILGEPENQHVNGLVGKSAGKPHISWENRWFPVNFPLNQSNQNAQLSSG